MLGFEKRLFLCAFIFAHLLHAESYNYGHRQIQMQGGAELGDISLPGNIPDFLKTEKWANAYVKNPTKSGVKTMNRQQNYYSSGMPGAMESAAFINHGTAQLMTYKGGCQDKPDAPMNSMLQCAMHTGCRATCMTDHQFPNGQRSLQITCSEGEWEVANSEWEAIPDCEPICLPTCQNNGICVAPGQCNCPDNFSGPQCQFEKKPCLNYPPLPKNSRRSCSSTSCTISCAKGHQFPDGSSATNVICKDGNWVPSRKEWSVVPNCGAVCDPPCTNGGNCLSLNVCQCPQDFRGPQCQYSTESCASTKLGFNGGYNCSGDSDGLSCSISCPSGIKFSFAPATAYVCSYATGVFMPQPVPQCLYGANQVITMGGSTRVDYKTKNSKHGQHSLVEGMDEDVMRSIKTGGTYGATGYYGSRRGYNQFLKNDSDIGEYDPTTYGLNEMNIVEARRPKPGVCFTWGGAHYKTFDGKVYSFNSKCPHVLVRDSQDETFSVNIQNADGNRRLSIFLQDKEYTLESASDGGVIFKSSKRLLPIPAQLPGLRVEMAGHMVQANLESLGIKIKWNVKQLVQVDVTESLWNRTEGLCGIIDGNPNNDMTTKEGIVPKSIATLANSWQVKTIGGDICDDKPSEQHACSAQTKEMALKATNFCNNLVTKSRFSACSKIMDISLLLESCKWDYCGCPLNQPREECGCDSLEVYAGQCVAQGIKALSKWRDQDTCLMNCTGGRIYLACGPAIQKSCGSATSTLSPVEESDATCTEGCFCPPGTLLHGGKCVTKDQCPCRLRGKQFPPGATVPKDCNTCTCNNAKWRCTQVACGSRCSAVGDPHYQTFDGKRYNFMGQCTYYLIKGNNYSVEAENVACSGAISEEADMAPDSALGMPSCTKSVTIRSEGDVIHLKQGREVVINGKEITKLPMKIHGNKIRAVSSIFILVSLPNGLEVWWDGLTRVHIDAPASFQGKTKGLCGTFNSNQKDDFLTPEGDVEQSVIPFANEWKTGEKCLDLPDKEPPHPCKARIQNQATAERLCAKLKSQLFEECHWSVDVSPFYEDCMYDMCSCEAPIDRCLCPILGAYATECALAGVKIQWRFNVKECEVHCPGGQTYQVCGDSCARSCYDLAGGYEDAADQADEARCKPRCVEGCNCPPGQALDTQGECVPIGTCPCRYNGLEFPLHYKEVRPGVKQQNLCECIGAQWICRPASARDLVDYPRAIEIKDKCSAANFTEFTTCEPTEPITCKNMHKMKSDSTPSECHPGCQCIKGYILDGITNKCVLPENCPCHHGGKSYTDGQSMQQDCNACKCHKGKWSCEKRTCAGVCSTWGDSHFKSFDKRYYDFQGVCTYLLTKGSLDTKQEGFSVEIQNEVCGTSGVTCSKSVTLKVGTGDEAEMLTFTKDKPLPNVDDLKRIRLRIAGAFVFAEVPSLGIVLQWDKGTRVYVRADPKWKGRLKGLCGNFNDNEADDFQTPSGGMTETSSRLFGDSWKLQPHCPPAQDVQDTCAQHPERRLWASQRCSAIKREPFAACHSEVPPGDFEARCERDACACGLGGDCECLCTALAAYAHECASRGVAIKWRKPDLCPMQCDETCTNYSPCMSACPVETCDNILHYNQLYDMCPQDTCIEGCEHRTPCDESEVMSNSTVPECVPRSSCKPICMKLPNGHVVLEGEVIVEDDCHSCTCSRGKKICKGQPCVGIKEPSVTETPDQDEQKAKCKPGWTPWMTKSQPEHIKDGTKKAPTKTPTKPYSIENEPLPELIDMLNMQGAVCTKEHMVDIECRTIDGHVSAKDTGLEAECSLEKGLACRQQKDTPCPDFEIRVKCLCDYSEERSLILQKKKKKPAKMKAAPVPPVCDSAHPNQEHPYDCAIFYQCAPGMGPKEHPDVVEKTCGPHMLYNPKTMTCDWPQTVIEMKPECGVKSEAHPTIGTSINFEDTEDSDTVERCDIGKVWSECAVACNKVCLFYDYYLEQHGKCKNGEECIPGCLDKSIAVKECGKGYVWRDAFSCVAVADCTCRSHTGKPVKPGEVIQEKECEYCQCLNNRYICDNSTCVDQEKPVPLSGEETEDYKTPEKVTTESYSIIDFDDDNQKKIDALNQLGTIRVNTLTPPPECHPDKYKNLLWDDELPQGDQAFTASSSLGPSFEPKHARLNGKITEDSGGSWSPNKSTADEYIQVKLDHPEPVYGVYMQGSPLFDQYVTSFYVMHSPNGHHFSFVSEPNGSPEIFRGPVDSTTPMKQMFSVPVEADYVRIVPITWHDAIAVRFELIGCGGVATSNIHKPKVPAVKTTYIGVPEEMCEKPKVLTALPASFVTVSSQLPGNSKNYIGLDTTNAWQPVTNSLGESVEFDLGSPQNVTGVVTKGGPKGWVTAYTLKYSPDSVNWNPVVDTNREVKEFPANFDSNIEVTNSFKVPIHAQFVKLYPTKWRDNIQLRAAPQGCVNPETKAKLQQEPLFDFTISPEVETPLTCETCDGVGEPDDDCECDAPLVFDGDKCIPRSQCPCVVGHITYPIGATYEKDNCDKCTCKLGGVPDCIKKKCPKCSNGLVKKVSTSCECSCVPCPIGKRACPTSGVCINEADWCNGVQDCPDDERDCVKEVPKTTAEVLDKACPVASCPKGYKVVEKKPTYKELELMSDGQVSSDSLFAEPSKSAKKSYMRYYKGGTKGGPGGGTKGGTKSPYTPIKAIARKTLDKPVKAAAPLKEECVQWRCVSSRPPPMLGKYGEKMPPQEPCLAPHCPPGYTVSLDEELDEQDCPKYLCSPPVRKDAICNVTSRTFNTFDGTEYQYDICNHVLARDADENKWDITIQKNCVKKVCSHELLISQETEQVRLKPDLTIEYNGYQYTVDQTKKIGFQTQSFAISRLGKTLFYISTKYGFWVIYDSKANARIGVVGKLFGHVDGLCGFYNGLQADDKRKPDGSQTVSTEEFGNSWAHKDSPVCEAHDCPIHMQDKAWKICNELSGNSLSACANAMMQPEKSLRRCLEEVCECLQSDVNTTRTLKGGVTQSHDDVCKCDALQTFVTDCQAADQSLDMQGWRTDVNCPASCPPPLVHNDCFRRGCELSCSSLQEDNACPLTPGVCFAGCFCPEGLVRKGESCVPPTECRDCVCDGYGKPEYMTFDKRNFTFNGNCTYVAARDLAKDGKHRFQVFVTNGECPGNADALCTVALHVIYEDHTVHIVKTKKALESTVDGLKINHYPFTNKWLQLQQVSGKDISLLIPSIQLEIASVFHTMAFSIRLPSTLYGEKLEGLCGDCNGDEDNDLGQNDDPKAYGLSWLAPAPALKTLALKEDSCMEKPKNECLPLPPDKDPCFKIMDELKFGKCHPVVDPNKYMELCHQELCLNTKQVEVCSSLEAYARECTRAGICLDWRRKDFCPYPCENDLKYKPCGLGCQITCETYEKYTTNPSLCATRSEGCFCPEGLVLLNGTCIPHSKCFPCDTAGHYIGDTWQVDECTKCSCPKRGGVTCVEQSCATAMACTPGTKTQQLTKQQGQCCAEFICVPEPTESTAECDEPSKINCGYGQEMKLDTLGACPRFVCECIPLERCESTGSDNDAEMLEPGMEKVINSSGCCPRANYVCRPETCPEKPNCPAFHNAVASKKNSQCCPSYTCEPPSDKCLYDMEYEASPLGGEKKRHSGVETVPKPVGSSWQDGPCRSCVCKKIGGEPSKTKSSAKAILRAVCSVTQCPAISESNEFVTESMGIPFTCCPQPLYTACKHEGKIYKPGQEWKSTKNPCESYLCAKKEDGTLERRVNVKQCETECKVGFKYAPNKNPDKVCCGECIANSCVINGVEYKVGKEWTSPDYCVNYSCLNRNGTIQVRSEGIKCPNVTEAMKKDFVIEEVPKEKSCCKKITPIACKVNNKVYKVGEEWQSDTDACTTYKCISKNADTLEKRASNKECDTDCNKGWKYVPSTDTAKICCGECVPEACVVDDVERKIGEKWVSKDNCVHYTCLNKDETLQVEAVSVECTKPSKSIQEDFEIKYIPVEGECCKKPHPIACKFEGKLYKMGDTWQSNTNPCLSYLCAIKNDGSLEKRTNVKQCDSKCKQGWKYIRSNSPDKCCGECVPVACVVNDVEHKIGEEWSSADHCTNYFCLNTNGTLQVQSVGVTCPQITKSMKEDFEVQEIPVPGQCCKKLKPVACKANGTIHKVGEEWMSDSNPCLSYICTMKDDNNLEKQTNVKQCEKVCKPGFKYAPSKDSKKVCCGECIPVSCVVNGMEHKIGEEWTSRDHCTNYFCLNKNGTIQVQAASVTCPIIPQLMKENYELEEIPVEGKCCKKVQSVACKVNGEVYKEGSTWRAPDGDPCKNVTCTRDQNHQIVKSESSESCNTDCAAGWDYVPSTDPHTCCGQCVQSACIVGDVLHKPGKVWHSADNCTFFSCDKLADQLVVSSNQESCPDVTGCDPVNLYVKGCCKHCNITSLPQKTCVSESLPPASTVGIVTQMSPNHGNCVNKHPINNFKECKGSCDSGTNYNTESSTHETDCQCCQVSKYDALIVSLTCQDGYLLKKQVAIPTVCECKACIADIRGTKSGRKIAPSKTGYHRSAYSSERDLDLDDVEMIDPRFVETPL